MKTSPHFVVCIQNRNYTASLELRKLYEVIADENGSRKDLLRVIDESGEDYLYPKDYFLEIDLPQAAGRAVLRAASS
ncbi:MAG TPA: hypothetical protein VMB18_04865 [Terriglobales bacterium]|nr:hypothetical protein [Terriglobales bacterium]